MNSIKHPILLSLLLIFCACNKEKVNPTLEIPNTYNFENVSYSGQTQRLAMFTELKNYMGTSQTQGTALDINRLKAMYANESAKAQFLGNYEEAKQMKNKTFESAQADFDALLEELAIASQSTVAGSEGISGIIKSADGAKYYLIGEDGLDHAQVIEKGLMGALLYYQATSIYMGVGKMDVDNETIEEGEGTKMEHHWDEAFGYFGVPKEFPISTDGIAFWGSYSNQRDAILGSNQKLTAALLKGRAAISAKQLNKRGEAITEAREQWELIAVGSALHYLNGGLENFDDVAIRGHGLSEAIGFIYALQFNEGRKITISQVTELLELVAGSAQFADMNLYETTKDKLQMAKTKLAAYYGLEDKMNDF